jgi:hypothetical protein
MEISTLLICLGRGPSSALASIAKLCRWLPLAFYYDAEA